MQDFLVDPPPQATSCLPLPMTEREWSPLPEEEHDRKMKRMRGYIEEKEGWCSWHQLGMLQCLLELLHILRWWSVLRKECRMKYEQQNGLFIIAVFEYWSHGYADWVTDDNHQLGNCLLGRWWLQQDGGGEAPMGEGKTLQECDTALTSQYWTLLFFLV